MSQIPSNSSRSPAASSLTDRPHAPPTDEEAVYYEGAPMFGGAAEKVLGLIILGAVMFVLPLIYRLMRPEWPNKWVTIFCLVAGVVLWIVPAIITKSVRYRISNYRIDYERGFFSKDINTLELWHVEDIAFHQSIIERLLGIGTIRVFASDQTMPNLLMRGIPNARKHFEELKQRIIAVKRQTGVLKVDTGT